MRHKLRISNSIVETNVIRGGDRTAQVSLDGQESTVQGLRLSDGQLTFSLNGVKHNFSVLNKPGRIEVTDGTGYYQFTLVEPGLEEVEDASADELNSQMPGTVLKLLCQPGDTVERGEPLLILEAMKMEHEVCAPAVGVVTAYPFNEGDRVMPGDLLVDFAPAE